MHPLFTKKITFILLSGFFLLIPFFSQADTCTEEIGDCVDINSCTQLVPGDYDCPISGQTCCATTGATEPPPESEDYQEGSTGGFLLLEGHLVPCGRSSDDAGTSNDETESCTLCHLFLMLKNVFDLTLSLAIVTGILMITIGGVVYIVSAGNPNLISIAKDIIKKTLIGFGLMIAGWLLVFTLLTFLSTGEMVGEGSSSWFDFSCDTNSRFE